MDAISILFLILSILGGGLTCLIAYGAIVKKRHYLLTGLFYYSFLPIIGESVGMLTTKHPYHILFIGMFVTQMLISSIKKVPFNETDKTLMEYAKRMGLSLIAINLISAIFILGISNDYPQYLGFFHVIITLSLGYGVFQRIRGKMGQ